MNSRRWWGNRRGQEYWQWRGCTILQAFAASAVALTTIGCMAPLDEAQLRDRATLCLQRGMRFPDNPAVRAQAMEAAGEELGASAIEYLLEGTRDEHPGVRFAACMAIGSLGDPAFIEKIRPMANDADGSVRIGVYYALDRINDGTYRRAWLEAMRNDPNATVRGNAVMALGLLGNPNVIPLLKRVSVEDSDTSVRLQAIEAMALLGNEDAISRLAYDAFGGVGDRQPFALLALRRAKGNDVIAHLRNRLESAPLLETRLAAARVLAMRDDNQGYPLALASLTWNSPQSVPNDSKENQIMRARSMAAMALGEMHDRHALEPLRLCMENNDDPRIQLAAARAILSILRGASPTSAGQVSPSGS